jgi:hypothetical protein
MISISSGVACLLLEWCVSSCGIGDGDIRLSEVWSTGRSVALLTAGGVGEQRELKILTWLILPVVIRLSQRLSHACLSINKFVL